jgi:uncharacterized membrane protein YheB (UPF0754 family)
MEHISPLLPFITFGLIGALIGYVTNFIAVKMLFRPRHPIHFGLFRMQGLVPKRQLDLANSIGDTIHAKLIKTEDITLILNSATLRDRTLASVASQVEQFTTELSAKNPMVGAFLAGDLGHQVRSILSAKLEATFPKLLEDASAVFEEELNVRSIVSERIANFDLATLEELVKRVSAKELRSIEILGGILGGLIGILQAFMIPLFK